MRRIIFARTRYDYASYTDFWRLVELSGFPICYVDDIDMSSAATYILAPMNGEVYEKFGDNEITTKNARLLLWNIERPGGSGGLQNYIFSNVKLQKYFHKILVSDRSLARHCNDALGSCSFVYTVLGLHEDLGIPGSYEDKKYDLIHLACYSNHRASMFKEPSVPKSEYLGCSVATNGWGDARHRLLQQTRFMYATHQDEFAYIEPLRYTLAVAYGLPIIAEYSFDMYPYSNNCVILDDVNLPKYVKFYGKEIYNKALSVRSNMLRDFQFRDCVERAVAELGI